MPARHGADLPQRACKAISSSVAFFHSSLFISDSGGLAYFGLELQIMLHLGLHARIELTLGLEEPVARRAKRSYMRLLSFLGAKPMVFHVF